ncbi:AAA family ATPase [Devosia sp. XGJD_8]|uniref:AAA family ATPase n=1 Tax=Devosia sp. XGJD_8 TaxID=3391187 RepID=UPI003985154C
MLIEFRVTNFRSFRGENRLSLLASADKDLESSNVVTTKNTSVPRVLRAAGIYGANASGKSNLIRALQLMRGIVVESANLKPDQLFNVQPFRLDPETDKEPTEFELTFLKDGVRYQYGFALTANRIVEEWLLVYKTKQPQTWFVREYNPKTKTDEYKFSEAHFKGSRNVWKEATRPNALFLSTAIQLNSDSLKPIFDYIAQSLVVFENGSGPMPDYTINHIARAKSQRVRQFLSSADISIDEIALKEVKGDAHSIAIDLATGGLTHSSHQDQNMVVPTFKHSSSKGSAVFDFTDESEGTQKLFSLAGPLFDIFERGQVLIVDELDRSLHALLVRQLIAMFHDPEVNKSNAQLIFTTHDTSLLDGAHLRRDQVWFTEKDEEQASNIYPLTDFSPRKNEALERGYLGGRYGAVPILKRLRTDA